MEATISVKHQRMLDDLLKICKTNLPAVNEELVKKAFQLSYESHKNDFRASGEPYFNHPYEVAMIIAREIPLDDVSVVSALLHDVVEDSDISLDFLGKEFSKEIAEIVDGVTKIGGVFKGQEITQAENYRKLLLSMVKDVRVILVKFADRLHNMRTLEFVHPQKQRRIAKETLEIYAPFAHRFGLAVLKWELEDLAFKYLNKEAYEDIAKKIKNTRKEREAFISKFSKPIVEKLKELNLKYEMGGRPKHLYSVYRKMIIQNRPFEDIYDLLALRIILENNDPNECYYVLGVINQLYKPISFSSSLFKLNLYQDEIYIFTPKGDLRRLPLNSTPVDFAFEIHSNVGYRCIGAKVNGKIVPLDTVIHSGDQVEIITSKNQHPNKSWLQFVQTHKRKYSEDRLRLTRFSFRRNQWQVF